MVACVTSATEADSKRPRQIDNLMPEPQRIRMLIDPSGRAFAALLPTAAQRTRLLFFHLGGLGLIPLGPLDDSLIPLPGTLMATTGSARRSIGRDVKDGKGRSVWNH